MLIPAPVLFVVILFRTEPAVDFHAFHMAVDKAVKNGVGQGFVNVYVNINEVDLNKGLSKNINLNQAKSQGTLKGRKITSQRPTSAISTKKIKYNQDLDPAQRNRIMDVNYLHLSKLPESKKFSHVDKAIINPVQSTFSVKNIVDDNIKKHEKMMRPIVLYPDPVKIYNEQPDKTRYLPGALRNSQSRFSAYKKRKPW